MKELIIDAETKDSYAVRNRKQMRYCIYYNDIEPNIVNSNRVRWNLAHELGHIILGHHAFCKSDKLFRSGLAANTYNYVEAEADYFAQLILVPHVVLYAFKITTAKQLKELCQISNPAAYQTLSCLSAMGKTHKEMIFTIGLYSITTTILFIKSIAELVMHIWFKAKETIVRFAEIKLYNGETEK